MILYFFWTVVGDCCFCSRVICELNSSSLISLLFHLWTSALRTTSTFWSTSAFRPTCTIFLLSLLFVTIFRTCNFYIFRTACTIRRTLASWSTNTRLPTSTSTIIHKLRTTLTFCPTFTITPAIASPIWTVTLLTFRSTTMAIWPTCTIRSTWTTCITWSTIFLNFWCIFLSQFVFTARTVWILTTKTLFVTWAILLAWVAVIVNEFSFYCRFIGGVSLFLLLMHVSNFALTSASAVCAASLALIVWIKRIWGKLYHFSLSRQSMCIAVRALSELHLFIRVIPQFCMIWKLTMTACIFESSWCIWIEWNLFLKFWLFGSTFWSYYLLCSLLVRPAIISNKLFGLLSIATLTMPAYSFLRTFWLLTVTTLR